MKKGGPLKRFKPLVTRSRLPARSRKRQQVMVERRALVARLLAEKPHCEARIEDRCTRWSVDVHEIISRARGGSILDPANCMTLCRACHSFITDNPQWAYNAGFSRHSWERD